MIELWEYRILNYLLLVCILENVAGTSGLCNSFQNVLCKSYCEINGTVAYLRDSRRLRCSIKAVLDSEIPRSQKGDKTSVPPVSSTISCYKSYFEKLDKYKPALNITWTQTEQNIYDGYIKGYLITQEGSMYHASLNIEGTPSASKHIKKLECINFTFNCFGTKNEILQYNERLTFTIISLPMSHMEDSSWNEITNNYAIPDSDKCGKYTESVPTVQYTNTTEAEKLPKEEDLHWQKILVYSLLGTFFCLSVFFIWKCLQYKIKENQKQKKENQNIQHVFMIADTTTEDCERWHTIAQKIRDSTAIKVKTNWENSDARHKNFSYWYINNFRTTDAVIIIGGAQELNEVENPDAERKNKEFEILLHHYFRQFDSEEKITLFLTNKIEDKQYLETRKRKNWKVFLINSDKLLEDFYKYLRNQYQAEKGKIRTNFVQTKKKHCVPACVMKKVHSDEGANELQNANSRNDRIHSSYATSSV